MIHTKYERDKINEKRKELSSQEATAASLTIFHVDQRLVGAFLRAVTILEAVVANEHL